MHGIGLADFSKVEECILRGAMSTRTLIPEIKKQFASIS
jgi:hypothetical protein